MVFQNKQTTTPKKENKQKKPSSFYTYKCKLKYLYTSFSLFFMLLNSEWMQNEALCRWSYVRKCHSHINCINKE